MSMTFIASLVLVNMLGIFMAYELGVLVERIRWNDLIKKGYIPDPKKAWHY